MIKHIDTMFVNLVFFFHQFNLYTAGQTRLDSFKIFYLKTIDILEYTIR